MAALTLQQLPEVIKQEGAVENGACQKRKKLDLVELLKNDTNFDGIVLEKDDVEGLSSAHARWLVHSSIMKKSQDKDNLFLITQKCSLDALRDLVIEASIACREDIIHLLVAQAQRLENTTLSPASYHSMAIGYHLVQRAQSQKEFKDQQCLVAQDKKPTSAGAADEEMTLRWFKSLMGTDRSFAKAFKTVVFLDRMQPLNLV
jgi:hypothetical protein